MRFKYTNEDNKGGTLDIPLRVEDTTYSEFEDFQANERKYRDSLNEEIEEEIEGMEAHQWHLRTAVNTVIKGDISHLPYMIMTDDAESMLKNYAYQFSPFDKELSIERLYIHIINLFNSYKGKVNPLSYVVEWHDIVNGEEIETKYFLESDRSIQLLLGDPKTQENPITSKKYTSGEVLELLEFQRSFTNKIKMTGDHDGNISYNLGLSEMAILLRRANYKLPRTRHEFRKHVEHYKSIFAELPLSVVFDTRFFLLNTLKHYGKFLNINYSLRVKSRSSLVTQKKSRRRGKGSRKRN